jgi:7-cyano-7-deazaguanine synthase
MKIVCTFSGGMDSAVLLSHLQSLGHDVVAVSFDYDQRHRIELEYAKRMTSKLGVEHKVLPLNLLSVLNSSSALLGGTGSPIVPCRNTLMITSAWALAETIGAEGVAIGAHAGDAADFPDCRPAFLSSLEEALRLGSGKNIHLWRPFIHSSKADIARLGQSLGVNFEETYTCYKGGEVPCGECSSCVGRQRALSVLQNSN